MPWNNKWVEHYALRYAVGTIVGAGIIAYLYASLPPAILKILPNISAWGQGFALLAAGFAFCYVASAPLLLFHIARFEVLCPKHSFAANCWGFFFVAITWSLSTIVLWICFQIAHVLSMLVAGYIALLVLQFFLVAQLTRKRRALKEHYWNLCEARKHHDNGIVESYRDIREHGNAYYILIFEGVLAIALGFSTKNFDQSADPIALFMWWVGIILLWVAPAAAAWLAASRIEFDFVYPDKNS